MERLKESEAHLGRKLRVYNVVEVLEILIVMLFFALLWRDDIRFELLEFYVNVAIWSTLFEFWEDKEVCRFVNFSPCGYWGLTWLVLGSWSLDLFEARLSHLLLEDFEIPCLAFVVDIVIVGFVVEIVEVARESEGTKLVRKPNWDGLPGEGVGGFNEEDELGFVTPRRFKKLSLGNPDIFLDSGSI
nr:hypothetical protein [Tanacetum cinerariifolium]